MERDEFKRDPHDEQAMVGDLIRSSNLRMADRLRSPWWFHIVYGLAIACMAFGVTAPSGKGLPLLVLGLAGEIVVSRWRAAHIGFSRANPSRFAFLWSGAPWSTITFAVFVAALVIGVFDRGLPLGWLAVVAGVAGLVAIAFGPLADRATRRRLARPAF